MIRHGFTINLDEAFDHLLNAPIVEAVIHWRARPGVKLEPETLRQSLSGRLSGYQEPQQQNELHVGSEIGPEGSSVRQKQVWHGLRYESEDKRQISQFTRNGFVFSRLKPYEDWEHFQAEAIRLWEIYVEVAEPPEIERLGVRFINVIKLDSVDAPGSVLMFPPSVPKAMSMTVREFMHQTRFEIPGYDYNLNVIQTIQDEGEDTSLILDLDVFTNKTPAATDENLKQRLGEMRWIKNKAFFSFLTPAAVERFKE